MAIKLHGQPWSNNTVRAMAVLNEKGLDYELCPVDLRSGAHKKPEFLALNPFGQIPVFQNGDGTVFVEKTLPLYILYQHCYQENKKIEQYLAESRAITRYVATRYKETGTDLLPASSATLETWLQVEGSQFNPPMFRIIFELGIKPLIGMSTNMSVVENESDKISTVLDVYEAHLAKNKYLAGDEFTLADLNHMPEIYILSKSAKFDLINSRPHLKAWWEDISARPAWKKTAASLPF